VSMRPWLQDFSWGYPYGPAEVRAQIQATYDAGYNEWILWNAANVYTEAALRPLGKE
ncbi:MAG TPA: putative glycoside hydrolase, partial [Symbiobacteriaceae bacterium]|nr:putative glycoside hydrolase [Symbiobacteriaceae bacterium]